MMSMMFLLQICLDKYFATYNSMMKSIKENYNKEKDVSKKSDNAQKAFDQVLSTINLQIDGYSLSFLRDKINKLLTVGNEASNQIVQNILIEKLGDSIYFTFLLKRFNFFVTNNSCLCKMHPRLEHGLFVVSHSNWYHTPLTYPYSFQEVGVTRFIMVFYL